MQHSEENKVVSMEEKEIPLRDRITWPINPTEEKYPYDDWFDGSVWKLKQYEDFFISPESMRSAIYMAARRKGIKCKTHVPRTQDALYVQKVK